MSAKEGDGNWSKKASATVPEIVNSVKQAGAGRPAVFNINEVKAEIVTRLCTGESLPMICKDSSMPSLSYVNKWISGDPEFSENVKNARKIGADTLVDACYSIAAGEALSTGSIERDKLLCSVIKWIVAKRDPDNAPNRQVNLIWRHDLDEFC